MELLRYIQYEFSLVILDLMDPTTFNFNMHHLNELDIVFNESIKSFKYQNSIRSLN